MATSTPKSSRPPEPDLREDEVELGKVVGVFGVRGELRVFLHNPGSRLLMGGPKEVTLLLPSGHRRPARLKCRSGAGKRILGRIDGLTDRDEAAALKGTRILVPRATLPAPDEGEYYVADLQGLEVEVDGEVVGRLVDVHSTAAGDLVELTVGSETEFVSMSSPHIVEIDVPGGRLVLDAAAITPDDG